VPPSLGGPASPSLAQLISGYSSSKDDCVSILDRDEDVCDALLNVPEVEAGGGSLVSSRKNGAL